MVGGIAVVGLMAGTLSATMTGAQAAPGSAPVDSSDKIKPKLAQQLGAKGEAPFWVRFEARADFSAARTLSDWDARGQAVYDALKATAEESQKDTIAELEDAGVDYQAFYGTNAIRVTAGSEQLALDLAARSEVEALYPTRDYDVEKPTKGENVRQVNAVEWGVANINADDVWSQFGVTGEGITVANIDTGVQFDHPALVAQYRGNNGDGTFTHDYNWFRAAGSCSASPCDTNGHGTHTMGTMAGSDGGANQIGVAPGVNWIAANGCCPSDAALIASGEWMLAPTDLQGQNADPSKRPHIINNSWGSTIPTNDPFMEDIQLAWAAAGIFGSWSNGNSGPACQTSGSPGSRIINYSVGAYDVNNAIASFSGRGAGQDGELKPNISAPGVNVRSSLPGNGYGSFNGTSMAAPHLAGTVALLWSAAPALLGDVDATRALLNDTAIDSESLGCGGTADDNNVFGEGRLDALALLNSAPIGETGTIAGTVTDAASGDPIAGATVAIEGEFSRTVTTGSNGTYSVRLATGDYTVTASKFGYSDQTATVTITTDQTTTQDFAMQVAPSVTLSGTVADGSGHGWPLYAEISIEGPDGTFFTDPGTGGYSITLPADATYTVTVESQYPGYETGTAEVTLGDGDATQDFALVVDDSQCNAAGYTFNTDGVTQNFNSGSLPAGWEVVDHLGNGQVWRFDNPEGRSNLTGGDGAFAIMDSDYYGSAGRQNTSLVTPMIDMSALTAPVVGFKQDYNNLGDIADVDVSIDAGATWQTVLHQTTDVRGPREDVIQLPMAAGQSQVKVRFHNYEADFDWWWEVDDVFVGNRTCDPVPGGLVLGNVYDANTDAAVNGATVTSLDAPGTSATTMPTPADAGLDDGFYWMFSALTGTHPFEAKANQYSTVSQSVEVAGDDATRADFVLDAGLLTIDPAAVSSTMQLGDRTADRTFTITNDGGLAVDLELSERKGGFVMQGVDGSRQSTRQITEEEGAPLQQLDVPVSFAANGTATDEKVDSAPSDAPWTDIADYPSTVMDNRVVYLDGLAYSVAGSSGSASKTDVFVYDPAALAWSEVADLPAARNAMAVGVVDGEIVATGGWGGSSTSASTWVYDPAADSWSASTAAPVARSAAGQAVLDGKLYSIGGCTTSSCTPMANDVVAYDPASDTWETLADYPLSVAFASCAAVDGAIYCTGGNDGGGGTTQSFVYDPGADAWSPIAAAPVDTWASQYAAANGMLVVNGGVQAGVVSNRTFAYDPTAGSWVDLPNSNTARYRGAAACGLYKVGGSSGGFTATPDSETLPGFEDCAVGAADVEWMSIDTTTATLAPGESVTVTVTMDANVAQPGTYAAAVGVKENTPYSVEPVGVTMTVTPPNSWGKFAGTVSGVACDGTITPLPGATLQVTDGAGHSWTFETDDAGQYEYWVATRFNPLQVIAAKDGYMPQTKQIRVVKGKTTTTNFNLQKSGC
ncbi:MAG: carboxypeptidase regulatory-like domain-containing protein [Nocardioidaceae bacterium]